MHRQKVFHGENVYRPDSRWRKWSSQDAQGYCSWPVLSQEGRTMIRSRTPPLDSSETVSQKRTFVVSGPTIKSFSILYIQTLHTMQRLVNRLLAILHEAGLVSSTWSWRYRRPLPVATQAAWTHLKDPVFGARLSLTDAVPELINRTVYAYRELWLDLGRGGWKLDCCWLCLPGRNSNLASLRG